jgi:hypothetical protein
MPTTVPLRGNSDAHGWLDPFEGRYRDDTTDIFTRMKVK